jgi:putative oxidoreductase
MIKSELIPLLVTIGRVLLGVLFVAGGMRHVMLYSAISADIKKMGLPMPRLLLATGTAFQIIAGMLLIFGLLVFPAALGLIAFTIVASVMMLPFWSMQGGDRTWAYLNWLSNVGIVGGLLIVAAMGLE